MAGAQCSPYFFSTSWQNDNQAEVVGKYASDKGYKNVIAMAPNYQAGKDFIAGFKRSFKGGTVTDEIYTPLNQQDFSRRVGAGRQQEARRALRVLPRRTGCQLRQAVPAGWPQQDITVMSTSTVDGSTLPALRDAAIGMLSGNVGSSDFPNEANQKFVAAFEKKYNRIPSQYAAQGWDAAQLLDSAIRKVKGRVEDESLPRSLKAADFRRSVAASNSATTSSRCRICACSTSPRTARAASVCARWLRWSITSMPTRRNAT